MSICMSVDDILYNELQRFVNNQQINLYTEDGKFTEVFRHSSTKFLIPIGLFSSSVPIVKPMSYSYKNYLDTSIEDIKFPNLYPLQRKVVNEVVKVIQQKIKEKRPIYITLYLACGFGKTITSSYLMSMHKRKTVICVPNKILASQWKPVIEATGISFIISIYGVAKLLNKLEDTIADVLIIVSKHLLNNTFCKYIYDHYDLFILDESHSYNLMNDTAVSRFLTFYPPNICYFLTATPRLSNRIYCNDVINVTRISKLRKYLRVIDYYFESNHKYDNNIKSMIKCLDKVSNKYHIYTEKILSEDTLRNNLIINTIYDEYVKGNIHRVLVVTKLRKHMNKIYELLCAKIKEENIFLGDAENPNINDIVKTIKEKEKFIFISTLSYAGTGLDISSLDSLFICLAVINNMNIHQLLGRICRETESINRIVYLFPTTSIKEIKHAIGFFTQRIISLAVEELGFIRSKGLDNKKEEKALSLAFNESHLEV
ncbi:DNA helicase [Cetacean poxvirus 1]|nr:DNA helicase [Cetacean poxvirus 1]